ISSSERYREGFMVSAIERSLNSVAKAKAALETISGHKLDDSWTPVQVLEDGRLKNRSVKNVDNKEKTITYTNGNDEEKQVSYLTGEVKLDWRLDWPGRW